jgi:uncharacterized coiled-coil DUF342 family protein
MLTDKDIQKIIEANREVFATKEDFEAFSEEINKRFDKLFDVFATKEDLTEAVRNLSTKEDFNKLLTTIDAYAKKADTYFQEMVMLAHKVDRPEKWIRQIAEKLGIKLEY